MWELCTFWITGYNPRCWTSEREPPHIREIFASSRSHPSTSVETLHRRILDICYISLTLLSPLPESVHTDFPIHSDWIFEFQIVQYIFVLERRQHSWVWDCKCEDFQLCDDLCNSINLKRWDELRTLPTLIICDHLSLSLLAVKHLIHHPRTFPSSTCDPTLTQTTKSVHAVQIKLLYRSGDDKIWNRAKQREREKEREEQPTQPELNCRLAIPCECSSHLTRLHAFSSVFYQHFTAFVEAFNSFLALFIFTELSDFYLFKFFSVINILSFSSFFCGSCVCFGFRGHFDASLHSL